MLEHLKDIMLLTAVVYSIVESLEKFGLKRKIAHLLALPIGVLISFLGLSMEGIINKILYGIIIGILSVGSCDTACNIVNVIKKRKDDAEK